MNVTENCTSGWSENGKQIMEFMNTHSPKEFLKCAAIRGTMVCNPPQEEYEFLKRCNNWHSIRDLCGGSVFGDTISNKFSNGAYGNSIHHMYTLTQFSKWTGVDFNALSNIVEFGGGYGNFCKLIYKQGYTGAYTIFDLPELSKLQEWFLKADYGKYLGKKINLISDIEQFNPINTDVFIALWSLSETPLDFRNTIITKIGKPKYYMIAYQEKFENVDNLAYFKKFVENNPVYTWDDVETSFKGNRYLFGRLKN